MSPAPKIQRVTAGQIRASMMKRWAAPEWAIMWEVGEGTGRMSGRYADAVMMSLWPSRGLELHGVEIKISRSDWKREAADPTKAEAIAQYCDRWWIHTPPGVVDDLSELPPAWGLREFDGKRWKTIREAEKTPAALISRPFLAAMLRRADGTISTIVQEAKAEAMAAVEAERAEERKSYLDRVEAAVRNRTASFERMKEELVQFKRAFGHPNGFMTDYAKLGAAARALANCDDSGYNSLSRRLRAAAAEIDELVSLAQNADIELANSEGSRQ